MSEPARNPTRTEVDELPGLTVLEFGASWCPICKGARPLIDSALAAHPDARHLWIEDGPGKPLGRSFRIKLWPTLVFLREGREVARVVRPSAPGELTAAFTATRDEG
jgi:thioredoxin 1